MTSFIVLAARVGDDAAVAERPGADSKRPWNQPTTSPRRERLHRRLDELPFVAEPVVGDSRPVAEGGVDVLAVVLEPQ